MSQTPLNLLNSIGLLLLRLGFGGYMMTHGWSKAQQVMNGDFNFGDPIGIGPKLSLVLVAFAEFLCAGLVMIGLGTRLAAIPVVITMAVAAFWVHGGDSWTMGEGRSKDPALLFAIASLTLVFTGPGRFALDYLIWGRGKKSVA